MFKVGDYVTRKKYNHDILFKITDINNNKITLKGVELRLYADADINDLVKRTISKKKEINNNCIRNIDKSNNFLIPGIVLHIDSDKDYLKQCLEYYKNNKIKCFGFLSYEENYKNIVIKLLKKYNPNIIVITGHDAYYKKYNKYKNSSYFIETVHRIRKEYYKNNLIIVSGACQSDFEGLIKAGATYASSPKHINIHALDPAIIASYIALTENNSVIDLMDILGKTKYGSDGIGGIKTNGVMLCGYPRKDEN